MPDWNGLLAARLVRLSLRPAREREVIDELAQHLEDRYQELRDEGTSDEDAVRMALAELEDDDIVGRSDNLLAREMRTLRQAAQREPVAGGAPARTLFGDIGRDLVYAARMLRKSPAFSLAAIVTLALGIGANSAIFSLVNATLLQRLPGAHPHRVDYVFNGANWNVVSYPEYAGVRDRVRNFDGVAAWGGITASLNADREPDLVSGIIATGNLFETLGISAAQGRLLSRQDDVTPGAHPVVVISDRLWKSRFAGRADIVGHTIRLNGGLFTIVGVTPPEFPGPQLGVRRHLYVPMMMQALMRPPRAGYSGEQNPDLLKNAGNSWLFGLGRFPRGAARDQAQAELATLTTTFVRTTSPGAAPARVTLVPVDEGDPRQ